ncbi:MFS transporter [Actinocrispum wychmicini]|uniref:Putative MFS family arabinose efflux permease n=1 Tax=Actinocrispum wychmicini TaxID=1213861 RepID=A0A4R2JAL4_9PSEU|nr:MFS transporter [Actinocrispum wychmicini]TCO54902.1 putative MFS family arabinose efflux permease [Actinocrispum wychmicini]
MTRGKLTAYPDYLRFWVADTVSLVGTYVTGLAVQVLAVVNLGASATALGVLGGARWLPYLVVGLVAGVLVDRWRRRPILVTADLIRAGLLGLIPVLAATGSLTMTVLIGLMVVFGLFSLVYEAAQLSYLPRLVPAALLTRANARMEQTNSVAQAAGPMIAGWLVNVITAPMAILLDAVSYLVSGLVLRSLATEEKAAPVEHRHLGRELKEGVRWVYRHRMLAPLALGSHAWFLFNGMVSTVMVVFVLNELGFDAFALGVTYAFAGVGGVLGASLSGRFKAGPTIIAGHWFTPLGYGLIPLATNGTAGLVVLCLGQLLFGFSIGFDGPAEMGFRQSVTPDRLQGRMNATIRSFNRGMIVIGAPLGGALADALGNRTAMWIAVGGLVVQAVAITCTPLRHASIQE